MPSPDLIAPDRLEELLGGALPEADREARLQGLVRELRADAPAAPAPLRARVHVLGEQPARCRRALPRRRTALALAFMLLAVAAVGAGLALRGGEQAPRLAEGSSRLQARTDGAVEESGAPETNRLLPLLPAFDGQRLSKAPTDGVRAAQTLKGAAPSVAPAGRATDVDLWMEIRLADADELSGAASEAMGITRELGGWVAASDIDTEGKEGAAELELRVPVGKVEDAMVRLGELGTVTGQQIDTADLQAGIDRRTDRIERLERQIRILELRLESGTLTPEEELRLRLRIERHENEISDLRRAIRADRRAAATSELTLALHTREAAAIQDEDDGGVAGVTRDALDFLGAAGAVALFLVIVLSPIVLLLVLLWLAFRARSRRLESRLLERPDPASPPSA
jgi:Domain of unknown function (DUF4349)